MVLLRPKKEYVNVTTAEAKEVELICMEEIRFKMEEINVIKMYNCKICGRSYVTQDNADRCSSFNNINKDWTCRPDRGR